MLVCGLVGCDSEARLRQRADVGSQRQPGRTNLTGGKVTLGGSEATFPATAACGNKARRVTASAVVVA